MNNLDNFYPEYYAIRWGANSDKPKPWNIYNNMLFSEEAKRAVRKYDNAPSKFKKYINTFNRDGKDKFYYGWEAFVKEIDSLLMWQFWSRTEYEVVVTEWPARIDKETGEVREYKLDVYEQCKSNVETIAHDLLRQYREFKRR